MQVWRENQENQTQSHKATLALTSYRGPVSFGLALPRLGHSLLAGLGAHSRFKGPKTNHDNSGDVPAQ